MSRTGAHVNPLMPRKLVEDAVTAILLLVLAVLVDRVKEWLAPLPAAASIALDILDVALVVGAIVEIIQVFTGAVHRFGELLSAFRSSGISATIRGLEFGRPSLAGIANSFAWGALMGLIGAGLISAARYLGQVPAEWFWTVVVVVAVFAVLIFARILIDTGPFGGLASTLSFGMVLLIFVWLISAAVTGLGIMDRFIAPQLLDLLLAP